MPKDTSPNNTVPSSSAPKNDERRRRFPLGQIAWLLGGCAITLAIVLALRATERSPTATTTATTTAAPRAASSTLDEASAQFAQLYLAYLLRTYYVEVRGFCPKLLGAICSALVTSDLIADEKSCQGLPNAELVLAIGRYQHGTGLPVDGKAGPETVRMILGGAFGSRREMASFYCPNAVPPYPSPSGFATGAP